MVRESAYFQQLPPGEYVVIERFGDTDNGPGETFVYDAISIEGVGMQIMDAAVCIGVACITPQGFRYLTTTTPLEYDETKRYCRLELRRNLSHAEGLLSWERRFMSTCRDCGTTYIVRMDRGSRNDDPAKGLYFCPACGIPF